MATLTAPFLPPEVAPGPRYRTVFGWFADFRRDQLHFMEECRRVYGGLAVFRAWPLTGFVVLDPELVQQVLERNVDRYWKGKVFGRVARHAGNGVLFSDGARWKELRHLTIPAFKRDRLAQMGAPMVDATLALIERWEQEGRVNGPPFDLLGEMSMTALDIAGRVLFGTRFGNELESLSDVVTELLEYSNYLINHAVPIPARIPTKRNRSFLAALRKLDAAIQSCIAERRSGERRDDLLQILLDACDGSENELVTARQVRDECITFLGAGHETTGVTLAWAFYLLGRHPEAEERLREEVDRVLGGRVPSVEDLPKLEFARRITEETLRLYPAAWAIGREAYGGDTLGGHPVRKGAGIFMSPWVTHRDPEHWEDPERFDPDRFLPDRARTRHRYAYFPFGGGPRRCIGESMALMEIPLVLAALAQRYRLRLDGGRSVRPYPLFTLRPHPGIITRLEPR